MVQRWLHYIYGNNLVTWRDGPDGPRQIANYRGTDEGLNAFARWLSARAGRGIHTLLLDTPNEEFLHERLPRVSASDRHTLWARKRRQQFGDARHAITMRIRRDANDPRMEHVLHVALTDRRQSEPWLGILQRQRAAVRALLTPSLLTNVLLTRMKLNDSHGFLLARTPAGIRQIFFNAGQLCFARLSPHEHTDHVDWVDDGLRQTQKLRTYLQTQGLLARDVQVPVWVLQDGHSRTREVDLPNSSEFDIRPVDIETIVSGNRHDDRTLDVGSAPVFVRLALKSHVRHQLAQGEDRRHFLWRRVRQIIHFGSLAALLIPTGVAFAYMHKTQQLRTELAQTIAQTASDRADYERRLSRLPHLSASLQTMDEVIAALDQQTSNDKGPRPAFEMLSHALDRFPDIELDRLQWRSKEIVDSDSSETASLQEIIIDARLPRDTAGDPADPLEQARNLAAEVRRFSHADITLTQSPSEAEVSGADKNVRSIVFRLRALIPGGEQ